MKTLIERDLRCQVRCSVRALKWTYIETRSTYSRHLGRVRFYVSEVIRKRGGGGEGENVKGRECNFSFFDKW